MIVLLAVGYGWLGYRMEAILICAAAIAGLMGRRAGYSWNEMLGGVTELFRTSLPALLVIVCIGIVTATWTSAGTVPMLICYGMDLMSPRSFLITASLVCSIVSLCTGTSWEAAHLSAKNLSRTCEDSGTGSGAADTLERCRRVRCKTLGVSALAHLPWAIMNYTGVLFALIYGATGFGISKLDEERRPWMLLLT